jgi:hypothetical protein
VASEAACIQIVGAADPETNDGRNGEGEIGGRPRRCRLAELGHPLRSPGLLADMAPVLPGTAAGKLQEPVDCPRQPRLIAVTCDTGGELPPRPYLVAQLPAGHFT